MKLSIITISYNNLCGLKTTVPTVLEQQYYDFEYIVVDGGSQDGSKEFLQQLESLFDKKGIPFKWVSEKDTGIYNAMNKGVAMASGIYCNFMNAGDYFVNAEVLKGVFSHDYDNFDILIGRAQTGTRIIEPPIAPTLAFFYEKCSLNHQAAFIKRWLLEKYPYDETPGLIVSDWKFFIEALLVQKCSYFPLEEMIVFFDSNGIGSQDIPRNRRQQDDVLKVYFNERVLTDIAQLSYNKYYIVRLVIQFIAWAQRVKKFFSLKSYDNNLRLSKKTTKWLLLKRMLREIIRRLEIRLLVGRDVRKSGINKTSRECSLIVSLTSYPARMETLDQTLESLLTQSLKPDKIILWLTACQFPNKEADIPYRILRYIKYGLEIKWYEKPIKSYTKLVPTLQQFPESLIVCADDDILYRRNWLKGLYQAYQQNPSSIYCYAACNMTFNKEVPSPYNTWERVTHRNTSNNNLLLGVAGVLYPPHCLYPDVDDDKKFARIAPSTDDLWFWAMAILNNTPITVIHNRNSFTLQGIGVNNNDALFNVNSKGGNDTQLKHILNEYPTLLSKVL